MMGFEENARYSRFYSGPPDDSPFNDLVNAFRDSLIVEDLERRTKPSEPIRGILVQPVIIEAYDLVTPSLIIPSRTLEPIKWYPERETLEGLIQRLRKEAQ